MTTTTDVRFWDVRKKRYRSVTAYEVRWVVAGKQRSRSRRTKELTESFLAELRAAAKRGDPFEIVTGLPKSSEPAPVSRTWLDLAIAFIDVKWPRAAAKSRDSYTDALATITAALVTDVTSAPDSRLLRTALRQYLLPPAARFQERPYEIEQAAAWLQRHSLPITELAKAKQLRRGLDALTVTLAGTAAAPTTVRRMRAVFNSALQYAVELEYLPTNNLRSVGWRPPKTTDLVDRRVVINPRQARELLTAVTYIGPVDRGRHFRGFFAVMYYAGLRPAEAQALSRYDCMLPEDGWGHLTLAHSRPETNRRWTNSGVAHEERGLKHRGSAATRRVPIPPTLVRILREHLAEFGTAADGRLFHTRRGGVISSGYTDIWAAARVLALKPEQVASPLANRPYTLRHAAVSLWLNAGVPPTDVAERAGHSVDVLLRVYASCIDGGEAAANQRIETALGPD